MYTTRYVCVDVGVTVTVAVLPAPGTIAIVGLHVMVPPSGLYTAVRVALSPKQRLVSDAMILTLTDGFKVRIIESTVLHPVTLSVTVTKYLVVFDTTVEVIVGLDTVVLLKWKFGDQL